MSHEELYQYLGNSKPKATNNRSGLT